MNPSLQAIGNYATEYLANLQQRSFKLSDIRQIPGGASRETYLITLRDIEAGGDEDDLIGVVLRRDPPSSLIDTERALEYQTYAAVYNSNIMPVPEPIVLEQHNPGALERPFSIMAQIPQGQAGAAALETPQMAPYLQKLGTTKWTLLGDLAKTPLASLGVEQFMSIPDHPALHELEYWSQVIRADALHPQPIAEAAIRWLERHLPPPSKQRCLVHGDYRTGNFLFTEEGDITAVLDWEMAHIGDPLEDLAWSLDPLWSPDLKRAGRLLPRREAVEIWQAASGITVDETEFRWWQIFASVKAIAIWISSAEDYINGSTKEPILALAGWPMIDRQNRILLDRLAPESDFIYAEPLL